MSASTSAEILKAYQTLSLSDANESATRLKVIDRVLREILGWLDEDISPEEHVTEDGNTSYSDYILRTANTAIVVEAKKVGASFTATAGQRRVKLSNQFLQSELGHAIIQARDYARKFGIDYAVATNGAIWAIFPAQRHDQVKFNDSTAQVFWSLQDALHESYQEFYDLLSRSSVISGSLEAILLGRVGNQIENRKLGNFFSTNARGTRHNPMFPLIENEVKAAFSDSITSLDSNSFERCYVATPETLKFDRKIRMNVTRREPVVGGAVLRAMKKTDTQIIIDKFKKHGKKQSAPNITKPLAILLLGTVGAGKTTFLHYMRKVRINEIFDNPNDKSPPHWLHLDFLSSPSNISASEFIYNSLLEYINSNSMLKNRNFVRDAYATEIEALRAGPLAFASDDKANDLISEALMSDYQKVTPYVDKILKYATKLSPFFLIIDNVDQIENDDAQSKLFTESLAIARHLALNLVLCLRQSTFARHRNSPAIDAFDFETVQIDPPRISTVLSKRFALVKHLSQGKRGEFIAENGAKVKLDDISQIVDLLQGSVLGTEIGNRIEVLATEDVRLALRMTREFLERGYTNPGRALDLYQRTGKYLLPKHEAFRAIMLGTHMVYNEDSSSIANPFDARLSVNQMQLLRLYLLSAIVAYASESNFRQIDGSIISECMKKIGIGDGFTKQVLFDLCKKRFIFTANHGEPTIASSFVPSRLGGYIVRELICNFTFIENVMFDTYISDTKTWQNLRNLSNDIDAERDILRKIRLRVQRGRVFYEHMHESLKLLVNEARKRGLPVQWCNDVMQERKKDFRKELNRVRSSAKRNYNPAALLEANRNNISFDDDDFDSE
ncbi:hypothetical protein [Aeromonas sp. A600620]|uniref:hypothetical protein n=1 Tax=Aeromonas sp. A600620 TaxID=2712059 RepID=UPI003F8B4EE8